jgi:4-amino-4-deoxy-L-arabinose transferase-like glycosyltransferase
VAAGLAWLTKSPAFFLAPFFGLLMLVEWIRGQTRRFTPTKIWREFSPLILWFAVGAGVFVLLWPAMWVNPISSLSRVFSLASTYASEGHDSRLFFGGIIYDVGQSPWYFYPVAYVWRATPVGLSGLGLTLLALLAPRRLSLTPERRRLAWVLLLFAVLFTLFLSLSAKKFDRYLLPVFAPLDLLAGLGWLSLAEAISSALRRNPRWGAGLLLGVACLAQAAGTLRTYPYYLNYYNPMLGGDRRAQEVMLVGWGEGLDQAARYLNEKPGAENMKVISWSADGCFSYFFKGSAGTIDYDMSISDLRRGDYVVFYLNQLQRQAPSAEVLDYFAQFEPEYVVRIGNLEYAWIYDMQDAPPLPKSARLFEAGVQP